MNLGVNKTVTFSKRYIYIVNGLSELDESHSHEQKSLDVCRVNEPGNQIC